MSDMLNNRQSIILQQLLNIGNREYVTGKELAQKLNVSIRTVQKEVKDLACVLCEKGISVISITSKGYHLAEYSMEQYTYMLSLLENRDSSQNQLSAAEIIKLLLQHDGFVKVNELAEETYYSESKLTKDLKKVKEILSESNLFLEHKPYKGIRIVGDEAGIRNLILSNGLYYQGLFETEKERKATMDVLTSIVVGVLTENKYLLSDITLQNLLLKLYVSLFRSEQGNVISLDLSSRQIIGAHILAIAKQIAERINEKTGKQLQYPEVEYISLYLQSEKHMDDTQTITEEIEDMVNGMLKSIHEKNGIDFTNDYELYMSLAAHIKPMLLRINYNFEVKNPILSDITANYPLAYDVALTGADYLYDNYGIRLSRDEISYLGVYFALGLENKKEAKNKKRVLIISSERKGNTMIMRYMLMKRFEDQISELDFINISEFEGAVLSNYDAVFTTASGYDIVPENIPRINYFISSQDYKIIERGLSGTQNRLWFEDFFDPDLVITNEMFTSKETLLKKMAHLAVSKYTALDETDLYQSILKREKNGFTYFNHGLAIPHPDKMIDNNESFVVAAILPEEIEWETDEKVSIIFMVCINSDTHNGYETFYKGVTTIISNENLCNKLKECRSFDSFYRVIREISINHI